jgi:hypothetical protein
LATLTRENNETKIKILTAKDVEELIKDHEKAEAAAEKEKKEEREAKK